MLRDLSIPFEIGSLQLSHRLIQGPLAGVSAAPFRQLFYDFVPPAYAVTEMISAHDVLHKHAPHSRYLYRAPEEKVLCYQLSGTCPETIAKAAFHVEQLGADLIDINCGCPKPKIRQKGAGSALMDRPEWLCQIVRSVRDAIQIPLTVKLRIFGTAMDFYLAKQLEEAGADALIIHGRCWTSDYTVPCDFSQIQAIRQQVSIPVIANGDIYDAQSLANAVSAGQCDAYMISRAGCGKPWLYQDLLSNRESSPSWPLRVTYFMHHLQGLSALESSYQAVMQAKTLVRYYFRHHLTVLQLQKFYTLSSLDAMAEYLFSYVVESQS